MPDSSTSCGMPMKNVRMTMKFQELTAVGMTIAQIVSIKL